MSPDDVRTALKSVIGDIQSALGETCPALGDDVIPSKVMPEFDSTVWPAATTMLAKRLGVIIPNDVHIFGGKAKAPLLTLGQTIDLVCKRHQAKPPKNEAA